MTKVPDFYDYFPNFSLTALVERLRVSSLPEATQLTTLNLFKLLKETNDGGLRIQDLLSASIRDRQKALALALVDGGISPTVSNVFGQVRRDLYVAGGFERYAYLNVSLPIGAGSWLSMPGLVALTLEATAQVPAKALVEFGCGSCYFLALADAAFGSRVPITGYDIDPLALEFGRHCLAQARCSNPLALCASYEDLARSEFQSETVFVFTFTPSEIGMESFIRKLVAGSFWLIYPRILSVGEFGGLTAVRRNSYSGYQDYLARPGTVTLSVVRVENGVIDSARDLVGLVRFVLQKDAASPNFQMLDPVSPELNAILSV